MAELPTADQMLANARAELDRASRALSDAGDWLRSDWSPVGSLLTDEQADAKRRMYEAIGAAKGAIIQGIR